jgi:hypothetical protein
MDGDGADTSGGELAGQAVRTMFGATKHNG